MLKKSVPTIFLPLKPMQSLNVTLKDIKQRLQGTFTVADCNVFALYKDYLPPDTYVLQAGEAQKSLASAEKIIKAMLKKGVKRGDTIAAVGGGVTGDLTGFVASIFMRGIDWIFVPTTVVALADSSIGGKTGVNVNGLKNVAGSFCAPKHVLRCYDFLKTLPDAEMQNGRAEIVKTALLNKKIYTLLNKNACIKQVIASAAAFKHSLVKKDFLETKGLRRVLNMGHTIGHAIESVYGLSHGQSVAMGLVAEIGMMNLTDLSVEKWAKEQLKDMLAPIKWDVQKIASAAGSDKKNGRQIGFVVPIKIGKTRFVTLSQHQLCQRLTGYIARNKI